MDFDTIFFLFLFFFFILPQLLKLLKLKKKPAKGKKPTLVDRIGERLRKVAQEIEAQRKQYQNAGTDMAPDMTPRDIWQVLAGEEAPVVKEPVPEEIPQPAQQTDIRIPEIPRPEKKSQAPPRPAEPPGHSVRKRAAIQKKTAPCRYRTRALQNAVVWSEILGKPVSLR